jgi:hypothetical protein
LSGPLNRRCGTIFIGMILDNDICACFRQAQRDTAPDIAAATCNQCALPVQAQEIRNRGYRVFIAHFCGSLFCSLYALQYCRLVLE